MRACTFGWQVRVLKGFQIFVLATRPRIAELKRFGQCSASECADVIFFEGHSCLTPLTIVQFYTPPQSRAPYGSGREARKLFILLA